MSSYGLYLSASGLTTALYRLDVAANNLANLNTVGYKPDVPLVRQRETARVEDGLGGVPSDALLERLGGGAVLAPNRVALGQGQLEETRGPLDIGVEGEGFLVVLAPDQRGRLVPSLTRDGRLAIDAEGTLVQSSSGRPVLDQSSRPIRLDPALEVNIDSEGVIRQGDESVARLQLARVDRADLLTKLGDGLLSGPEALIARRRPASGRVLQGYVERSAVDPIRASLDVSAAERAVSAGARLISIYDELSQRAISTFGRVA
ncbi:MAG: hypothetical protein C0468_03325 [Planctomyces sp.]|nr:hypothetical protein [Planctomyces sp.]